MPERHGRDRTAFVLFAVACVLYAIGVTWGLPYADTREHLDVWSPDDVSPLAPLTEIHNIVAGAGPDRFLLYPLFHHFVLAVCYAPYVGWLLVSGGLSSPIPTYPFGLADPVAVFRILTLIARTVSIAMAAGTAVIAYRIGLTLWDRRTGVLAYALCGLQYPMVYYSKTGNLEVPVLFWTSLGLLVYARILVSGVSVGRAGALGACAALAAATKDQGAGAFLLLPLVLAPMLWRSRHTGMTVRPGCATDREVPGATKAPEPRTDGCVRSWRPAMVLLASGSTVYAATSGLAVEPGRYVAHLRYLVSREDHFARFERFVDWYPTSFAGILDHLADVATSQMLIVGPVVLGLALVGLADATRRRPRRVAFALPGLSHLVAFVLPLGYFYLRFTMPITFVLGVFAARGTGRVLDSVGRRRLVAGAIVCVVLAWPATRSVDLVGAMLRDSRYAAADWFADHAGASVGHFGSVGELPRLTGDTTTVRLGPDADALSDLRRARPDLILMQPDWTSPPGAVRSGWCPPEFYAALQDGALGYDLVARFEGCCLTGRQLLDYPSVSPPIEVYARRDWWESRGRR